MAGLHKGIPGQECCSRGQGPRKAALQVMGTWMSGPRGWVARWIMTRR